MKPHLPLTILTAFGLNALAPQAQAQITLTSPVYQENFDALGSGLPPGWSVRLGATATGLGTASVFEGAAHSWSSTTGGFHNYASTDGLASSASATTQAAATDRVLGVRATSSLGDPGAAFVLQVANSVGYENLTMSFGFHLLDEEARSVTWTADYGLGTSPATFAPLGTFTRGTRGSQTETFALPTTAWNQAEPLWIRLAALSGSTGSGSRDTVAIDDFELRSTPVSPIPEPRTCALVAGLGMLTWALVRRSRVSC